MGTLSDRLSNDLKDAMRAGDAVRRDEIRGVLAALKSEQQSKLGRALEKAGLIGDAELTPEQQAEADRLRAASPLSDDEEEEVLQFRAKQHRQSIDSFEKGNRQDLLDKELAQMAVLQVYLPQLIEGEALDAAITAAIAESGATGPKDMGKVMGKLSGSLKGRADMKKVGARVQALLGAIPA